MHVMNYAYIISIINFNGYMCHVCQLSNNGIDKYKKTQINKKMNLHKLEMKLDSNVKTK